MTGADMKEIRRSLGLSVAEFGRALGYKGNPNTITVHVRAMESGRRKIMDDTAALALELGDQAGNQAGNQAERGRGR